MPLVWYDSHQSYSLLRLLLSALQESDYHQRSKIHQNRHRIRMQPDDRTAAAEQLLEAEKRAESPLLVYAAIAAEAIGGPLSAAAKLFLNLNGKRIERLEYLRGILRDDLRDLREKIEEQEREHQQFYEKEMPSIIEDACHRAETARSQSKIRRIARILVHALVVGPSCPAETTEEMLRVAESLDDRDVHVLSEIVIVQGPQLGIGRDALTMNEANELWKRRGPKIANLSDGDLTSVCHKLESFGLVTRVERRPDLFGVETGGLPFGVLRKGLRFYDFALAEDKALEQARTNP
jgi:hypothetical protein